MIFHEDHGDGLADERWRQVFASFQASTDACNEILPASIQSRIVAAASWERLGRPDLAARERAAAGYS